LLAVLSVFLPLARLAGLWQSFHVLQALVYAPASAISQEVYFRAALLTVLRRQPGGERSAVWLQALLFSLWHLRAFRVTSPLVATAVLAVVFVGGLFWGWQVARDRTVLYAVVQHATFLAVQ
jgi:membrane protease YdiL (CAAX protease family)